MHERNYSVSENESFTAVCALASFGPDLMGSHFKGQTDHFCLRWLIEIVEFSETLMRWSLRLLQLDFEVLHKRGTFNTQTDASSRFGTTAQAEKVDDLEIPCFLVEKSECNTKNWSDDNCDNILASETSEPANKASLRLQLQKS